MTTEERKKKYDCDGQCYTNNSMCPMVETCPETRDKEFWATVIAGLLYISSPIIVVVLIVLAILVIHNL